MKIDDQLLQDILDFVYEVNLSPAWSRERQRLLSRLDLKVLNEMNRRYEERRARADAEYEKREKP